MNEVHTLTWEGPSSWGCYKYITPLNWLVCFWAPVGPSGILLLGLRDEYCYWTFSTHWFKENTVGEGKVDWNETVKKWEFLFWLHVHVVGVVTKAQGCIYIFAPGAKTDDTQDIIAKTLIGSLENNKWFFLLKILTNNNLGNQWIYLINLQSEPKTKLKRKN